MASLAIPSVARGAVRRRPEWPWVVLAVAAWGLLVAGDGGMGGGMHHVSAPGLGWWTLMVVAMMVPATIPALRQISFGSMWDRRYRSPLLFLAAYVAVWVAVGAVALAAWWLVEQLGAGHAIHGTVATGALLFVAANWQLAPRQRRFLKRCHRALALGARGRSADRACLRYGLFHGRQCVGACWPLMLAMVPGHGIALMAALTALSSWQRLARRPNRELCGGARRARRGRDARGLSTTLASSPSKGQQRMAIDQAAVGLVAAELMEELEHMYGEDATIDRVALVVAVDRGPETTVHYKLTPGTPLYVAKGLLAHVHENMGK